MDAEVLIVGAGPVGLLLANLLGSAGLPVLVLEKCGTRADTSRAIGVTRTSLEILQELGLAESLCLEGREVGTAVLHAGGRLLRRVEIRRAPGELPFIVSLPQFRTERILLASLDRFPSVRLLTGQEVDAVAGEEGAVRAGTAAGSGRRTFRGRFLCACDGDSSTVRRLLGVSRVGRAYTASFLMGDYRDRSGLGERRTCSSPRRGAWSPSRSGTTPAAGSSRKAGPPAGRSRAAGRPTAWSRWRRSCAGAPASSPTRAT